MPGHWYRNTDPEVAEKTRKALGIETSDNAEGNTVTRVYLDENHKREQTGKSPTAFWDNLLGKE